MFCQKTVRNQFERCSSQYCFLFTFSSVQGRRTVYMQYVSLMLQNPPPSALYYCRLSSLTLGGTVYSWMNLGLSLFDLSSANGQEKPAKPV